MRKHGIFIDSQVLFTLIFLQKAALDPCTSGNYKILNSSDRLVGNTDQSPLKCDRHDLIPGWYRFTGDAGDKIPNTRPPHTHRCGTHAPGWINGNNPAVADGEVNRTVCYFWWGNCSWNNNIKIKNCGAFYVYELQKPPSCWLRYCGEASECSNYTTLDQADRAVSNTNRSDPKCDRWDPDKIVSHKWYRMTGDSGDQIPERCVPIDRCGTRAPGWLNGTHPSVQDGLQTAQVCYHWNNDCCQWKSNIKIRNCSSYFVYQLVKHPACNLRYCVCAVITPISDKVITEGANLTLSCQATGVFPPTVFWVKTSSGQRTNGTELVLKNISRNEAGDYRCEARNLCGNASESAKIDVQFPAVIVPLVDRIIVQKGDYVKLFCNASGTPPPSVMWTHVHTGRKLYSETWLITAIQVGDLGEYRCDANNTYGHATDSVTIELEVPAFIVPFVDRIIVQKGDDVPLFCNASGTPPLFVMWTHVPTGRKQYSKTWLITAIQVDDLGEYRCDANNNYGHATDSVTIEFKASIYRTREKRRTRFIF
ncbi:uncharacterized protein [Montipora foliosa]|uniref:uncharacterized protein isoform X2 n=1 Tax=Montipora foliosa TaxID=591990 RepID=UPI0035F21120